MSRDEKFYKYISETIRATFVGIASQVRKEFNDHMGCLKCLTRKQFLRNPTKIKICPYALSYANWRKKYEEFKYYWEVDNGWQPKLNFDAKYPLDFGYNQEADLLIQIYLKFNKLYSEITHNNINSLTWALNRVISLSIISRLNYWISIAEELIARGEFGTDDTVHYSELTPFFIIIFPESREEAVQFHWWHKKNDGNHYKKKRMICPSSKNDTYYKYKLNNEKNPYSYLINSLEEMPSHLLDPFRENMNKQGNLNASILKLYFTNRDEEHKRERTEFKEMIMKEKAPALIESVKTETSVLIAKKLLSLNVDIEIIMKATGLSKSDFE